MSLLVRKRRRRVEVNIIPLVDVLIVLIFFFLMTMQFRSYKIMDILPPKMESAGKDRPEEQIFVMIDEEGKCFYQERDISIEELRTVFKGLFEEAKDPTIVVLSDENTPLHFVTSVMDQTRLAGLKKVRLQVR